MSEEFFSIPTEEMSDYLEGILPKEKEREILLKVNTIEDLWVLAQMRTLKKKQSR